MNTLRLPKAQGDLAPAERWSYAPNIKIRGRGLTMVDYVAARAVMVNTQLRTSSITDRRLLTVMGDVPRERFLPEARRPLAYADVEHRLDAANGRAISTPAAFGRLVQLARIKPTDIVLDIACGTGYSTAILAGLANAVVATEDDEQLVGRADAALSELEIGNAAVLKAGLTAGLPSEAPFDVIVIEGSVDFVPEALFAQLKEGGRLVTSMRRGRTCVAEVFVNAEGDVTGRREFDLGLPPLAPFRRPEVFAL